MTEKTKVQLKLEWLQNRKWLALLVVGAIIIIATATFTDSVAKLISFVTGVLPSREPEPALVIENHDGRILNLALTNPTSRQITITGMKSIPYKHTFVRTVSSGEDRYDIALDPFDPNRDAPFFAHKVVKVPPGDVAAFTVRLDPVDHRVSDAWLLIAIDYVDSGGHHNLVSPYAFRMQGYLVSEIRRRKAFECEHAASLREIELQIRRRLQRLTEGKTADEVKQALKDRETLLELESYIPRLETGCKQSPKSD
jgi:hypothetical protein